MVARSHELKIINTVCPVTIRRQEDTVELARDVDLMVVVGGKSSANTKELTRLCEIVGTRAVQIQGVADLSEPGIFDRTRTVGVTGGTSTPDRGPARRRAVDPGERRHAGGPGERRRARRSGPRQRRDPGRPHDLAPRTGARRHDRRSLTRGRASAAGSRWSPSSGRPNVGKSTLFNRIVGERAAIVEDRARTTRDRLYGDAEWNGRRFVLVDTGGLELDPGDPIEARVQEQARLAIAEADVIVFVADAAAGLTPADSEAAEILRRAKAPVIVAVNKADNEKREIEAAEFHSLGWDETYAISATHGRGTGDLLDAVVWSLPPESEAELARKAREAEAETWAEEVAAGRLEPFVVGEDEATRTTRRRRRRRGGRRGSRRPRSRRGGRPRGTRPSPPRPTRNPPRSRSSVARTSASRACSTRSSARSGSIVSEIPGHDARRHRHPHRVGSERGRAHRHGRDPSARQGRLGRRRRNATRRCARSAPCRAPTSPCSSSMPSRA